MKNAKLFFMVEHINNDTFWLYTLFKFRHMNSILEIQFGPDIVTLKCSCMMFESIDIPCCHMVVIMKVKYLKEISSLCILKRWEKLGKSHLESPPVNEMENDLVHIVRYSSLSYMCNKLSYYASQ